MPWWFTLQLVLELGVEFSNRNDASDQLDSSAGISVSRSMDRAMLNAQMYWFVSVREFVCQFVFRKR